MPSTTPDLEARLAAIEANIAQVMARAFPPPLDKEEEAAFEAFFRIFGPAHDKGKAREAWASLTPDERRAAERNVFGFFRELCAAGRSTTPACFKYLSEKRWTLIPQGLQP